MKTVHAGQAGPVRPVRRPFLFPVGGWRGRRHALLGCCLGALVLGGLLAGCDETPGGPTPLQPSRIYEPVGRRIRWQATPAERFGISARDFAGGGMGGGQGGMGGSKAGAGVPGDDAGVSSLHWTAPPGWVERPAAMFREANFFVVGDERAECYLTTLGGDAGGLEANINRWRSQLALPPIGPAEVAALPTLQWLGGTAIMVDIAGRWKGMSGDQSESDYRLVGLALVQADRSRFLKMVGPADVIGREVAAFRVLAASFHESAGHEGATAPSLPPGMGAADLPPDHPTIGAEARTTDGPSELPGADTQGNASLTWSTPAGWTRGPEKTMREVTYLAGAGNAVECYVTLLAGSGGGLLANINRWCTQMGAHPLSESDLPPLERVPMAGGEGVIVRLQRGPGASAAAGQDLLLGAVCQLPERALFVKMTGPAADVEAQHGALVEFCKSIETAR